jgi:hypothetical protein
MLTLAILCLPAEAVLAAHIKIVKPPEAEKTFSQKYAAVFLVFVLFDIIFDVFLYYGGQNLGDILTRRTDAYREMVADILRNNENRARTNRQLSIFVGTGGILGAVSLVLNYFRSR